MPYYFKLGSAFGALMSTLVAVFQATCAAATLLGISCVRPAGALATTSVLLLSSGPKNAMLQVLGMQAALYVCVLLPSRSPCAFVAVVALEAVMTALARCAALFEREITGPATLPLC